MRSWAASFLVTVALAAAGALLLLLIGSGSQPSLETAPRPDAIAKAADDGAAPSRHAPSN